MKLTRRPPADLDRALARAYGYLIWVASEMPERIEGKYRSRFHEDVERATAQLQSMFDDVPFVRDAPRATLRAVLPDYVVAPLVALWRMECIAMHAALDAARDVKRTKGHRREMRWHAARVRDAARRLRRYCLYKTTTDARQVVIPGTLEVRA